MHISLTKEIGTTHRERMFTDKLFTKQGLFYFLFRFGGSCLYVVMWQLYFVYFDLTLAQIGQQQYPLSRNA